MSPWRALHVIRGGSPFQVCTLAACLAVGLVLVVTPPPVTVRSAMPPIVQNCWQFGLIAAGVLGLVGVWWPGRFGTGLCLELAGVITMGTVTTMYGVAIAAIAGLAALAAGAFICGLAVASWWRTYQIIRDLLRASRFIRERGSERPIVVREQ